MQVSVLASGSKGNSIFIEMEGVKLLIDAGISARRIKQAMADVGQDIQQLDAIFITHEHKDHVAGLVTLCKKYRIPVYSRPDTFRAMRFYSELPMETIFAIKDSIRLGRVLVKAFSIPHDAADPVGYSICGSSKCTIATDLGFVTADVRDAMENSRVLILEANHDIDMLRNGSYAWPLKQRILSNRGHLANDTAGWALANLKHHPRYIFLAHLSENNNTPEMAMETVKKILIQRNLLDKLQLIMTSPDKIATINI